jgi:hypothetical protein
MTYEERANRFRDWYNKEMTEGRLTEKIAIAALMAEFSDVAKEAMAKIPSPGFGR